MIYKHIKDFIMHVREVHKSDPVKYCTLYLKMGCAHIDGPDCDFPMCEMYKTYMLINTMHTHPDFESIYCDSDHVLVDSIYSCLFTQYEKLKSSSDLIMVLKTDFENLKNK